MSSDLNKKAGTSDYDRHEQHHLLRVRALSQSWFRPWALFLLFLATTKHFATFESLNMSSVMFLQYMKFLDHGLLNCERFSRVFLLSIAQSSWVFLLPLVEQALNWFWQPRVSWTASKDAELQRCAFFTHEERYGSENLACLECKSFLHETL